MRFAETRDGNLLLYHLLLVSSSEPVGWLVPPTLLGDGSRHCHGINIAVAAYSLEIVVPPRLLPNMSPIERRFRGLHSHRECTNLWHHSSTNSVTVVLLKSVTQICFPSKQISFVPVAEKCTQYHAITGA